MWKLFQKKFQTKNQSRLRNQTAIETQEVKKHLEFHVTLAKLFHSIHYLLNYHNNPKPLCSTFYLQILKSFFKGKEFTIPTLEMQKVA